MRSSSEIHIIIIIEYNDRIATIYKLSLHDFLHSMLTFHFIDIASEYKTT